MGRYKPGKVKKSNGTKVMVLVVGLILTAIGAAGFYLADQLVKIDNKPLSIQLTLPNISQPEPETNEALLDIAPVQSAPIAEVIIGPDADRIIIANPADNQPGLFGAQQLPELEGSGDALFRDDLIRISPKLADWLSADDLIRKYLVLLHDVSQETLLAKHSSFLKPKQAFIAEEQNKKMIMSAKSYERFDELAAAVDKMDVEATLVVYKKFRPLFAKVFAEFSYPEIDSMEDSFTKAAAEMLVVPIIEQPLELVRPSVNYKYADAKLEALNPVQKQMLRMGPKNTRLIQNKVRQLVESFINLKE